MPLITGLVSLQATLADMYSNPAGSAADNAKKTASALHDFVITGIPMTIITTFPGAVNGAMTASNVEGKGIGGLDKPAPGMGLDAAKSILESDLTAAYAPAKTAATQAQQIAVAIMNYFSQAIVMTNDKTDGPLPAPPPAGPVAGSISGKGGVVSDSPGSGYDSAKSALESDLTDIYNQVGSQKSAADQAKQVAAAIHKFCKEGKVETKGTFLAPAVVAPPPAPPNGAYLPGAGLSASATLK